MKIIIEKRQVVINDVAREAVYEVRLNNETSLYNLSLSDLTELRDKINEILK